MDFNYVLVSDDYLDKIPEVREISKKITPEEINTRSIKKEYQLLKKITSTSEHKKKFLKNPDYLSKCRYKEIPLYGQNIITTDKKALKKTNFINANYIPNIASKKIPRKKLIITQGPLQSTLEDFWKMIENNKTKVILAIIERESLNKKCFKYWPDSETQIGDYKIKLFSEKNNLIYDYKKFVIENIKEKKIFEVEHYHLFKWDDYGIVEKFFWKDLFEFLKIFLDKFCLYDFPVIHCSAGIGRSGTFVSLFFLFFEFRNSQRFCEDFFFSVFDTVRVVREFRWQAVESEVQYQFLYDFLEFMVKNK